MKKLTLSFLSILAVSVFMLLLMGNSFAQNESSKFQYRAVAEVGFVSVLSHKIQLGNNGNYFDYAKEGGQDVLSGCQLAFWCCSESIY